MTRRDRQIVKLATDAQQVRREGNKAIWSVHLAGEMEARTVDVHCMAGTATAVMAAIRQQQEAHNAIR